MIELKTLTSSDREQFIKDNQDAFNYGALEELGRRDDHFEEDGEIYAVERGVYQISLEATDMGRPLYENCGFEKSNDASPMFITSLWT